MFKWLTIIRNLSKEENYIEKQEQQIKDLTNQIQSLQKQQEDCRIIFEKNASILEKMQDNTKNTTG